MRSTGEVMGIDRTFGLAFAKSQAAAGDELPAAGTVFFSLADRDKAGRRRRRRAGSSELGFQIAATSGHRRPTSRRDGVPVDTVVAKVSAVGEAADPPGPVRCRRRGPDPGRARSIWWSTRRAAAAPGRRRLHPPGRQSAPGRLPDDGRRRPGGGRGHRRAGRDPLRYAACRSTTAEQEQLPADRERSRLRRRGDGSRPAASTCAPGSGDGRPRQPDYDRLGHRRPRRRTGRLRRPGRAGRGRGQVALRRALGRQPGRRGCYPSSGGHAQQRRAAEPGRRRPGWPSDLPPLAAAGATGRGQHLGLARPRTTGAAAAAERPRGRPGPPRWSPWRPTLAAPTSRTAGACSPTRRAGDGRRHRRGRRGAGRRPAAVGQAQPQRDRPDRDRRGRHRRRRGGAHPGQHRDGPGPRPGHGPAPPGRAAGAACPGRPSIPSPCGPCTSAGRPCPASPIVGVGGVAGGETPPSCWPPGPTPYRWAPPPSPTRGPRPGRSPSWTAWCAGHGLPARRPDRTSPWPR